MLSDRLVRKVRGTRGALLGALALLLLSADAYSGPAGTVVGTIEVQQADGAAKADRSGIAVYLELPESAPRPAPTSRIAIKQRDLAFDPGFNVVAKGTAIDFPNEDKVFHNVFSLSQPSRFDLGLYKSGESKAVTFNRPGVVDIYCNIHPQMVAKVLVVDTQFFGLTARDGTFRITNVSPGTYPVIAWERNGGKQSGQVIVEEGKTATVRMTLRESRANSPHVRKDGTPYGRYQ